VNQHRGNVFVFVITIENHGPWTEPGLATASRLAPDLMLVQPETAALERYLTSLRNGDEMLSSVCVGAADGRLVGFYGDHQPSLHLSTHRDGDNSSDYVIWQGGRNGNALRIDLAAHEFGEAFLRALAAIT
jgi:hypothetical protein